MNIVLAEFSLCIICGPKSSGRAGLLPPIEALKEEPVERYCSGGCHPVNLGDMFDSRY